jgi:phosphonate transport system substrate-binding protein
VLWQSEPLHDLALMAARKVPERDVQAVAKAFIEMSRDPAGQRVLAASSEAVRLPASTQFVASNGSEYGAYRNFYQTAPASLR